MTKKHNTLSLRRVSIVREGDYYGAYRPMDASKPFRATVEVEVSSGKVELNLSADLSQKIVAIIAGEVAEAGRATAEIMVADALFVSSEAQKALAQ